MISSFYFFDQFSRASHIGGVCRSKRDLKDLDQALYHVKIASTIDDDHSDKKETITSNPLKKQTDDVRLPTNPSKLKTPIIPEILTKELDKIFQLFDEKSKPNSASSDQSRSRRSSEQSIENEKPLINPTSNLPKISLPSLLIVQLHSTWSDLIQNTQYKYKVWRTKAGEEVWRQHVQKKRSEQLNSDHKPILHHRASSRVSLTSVSSLSHRQSLTTNPKIRVRRSSSRASFLSTSNTSQDNLRLLKAMHHGGSDESIKNGIHVEFKLSTQIDQPKQHMVLFDVPKPEMKFDEDIITLTQIKCKRLLAETKEKILATNHYQNMKQQKICRIWFYGDNQHLRNKNYLLILNESNRRQKSKFALMILRHEIPEKYNIDIDIPETKHKCYIELIDGTSQIYYPSGRLAVLRLQSPSFTTLFFDDIESTTNQFLGLVTSKGNVLLMQPTFHARFITNNRHEHAYLCNGKTGIIEKELDYHLTNNSQRQSISIDENDINSVLFENTIQLQINSYMQLEYHNPSNIRFAFTCQNEKFQFQLGVPLRPQTSTLLDLTTKRLSQEKHFRINPNFPTKRSSSINSNDISNVVEKQQTQSRRLSDEQFNSHQLPMMQELILLRKRIKHICDNWLKECRTTLGIMDIDAYCLSDLPTEEREKINDRNRSDSAKLFKPVPLLTKRASCNNEFIKSIDKHRLLTINSMQKSESNVIANVIEQYTPHSDAGRAMKQRIYTKKKILPTTLPVI